MTHHRNRPAAPPAQPAGKLPLVMLHGLLGLPDNWDRIVPLLPEGSEPIILHIPFFDAHTELTSIPSIIGFIQKYMDDHGFGQIVLMGNSFGGHVGALFAARLPQRVCGLVLVSSGGLGEKSFSTPRRRPERSLVREKARDIFYDGSLVTEEMVDYFMNIISDRAKGLKLLELAKCAKRDDITESLMRIRCPTLIIWGRQDKITPPRVAQRFHALVADSRLVWIDKCGHAPMMEHPEELAREVRDWWGHTFRSHGR